MRRHPLRVRISAMSEDHEVTCGREADLQEGEPRAMDPVTDSIRGTANERYALEQVCGVRSLVSRFLFELTDRKSRTSFVWDSGPSRGCSSERERSTGSVECERW